MLHIINESATQNEDGERVGWINRIFGYAYHVRLVGKRMKAWNEHVYYAVKYLLIGGIFAAFLAACIRLRGPEEEMPSVPSSPHG